MTQPRWSGDDELLGDLRDALAHGGPVSAADLEAGRRAYEWRTVDEELAALTYDSLLDDGAVVRGASASPRSLVFEAGDVSVEVDVLPHRLVGQLVPGAAGDVVVQSGTEVVGRVQADDAGCFSVPIDPSSAALVRLRCTTGARTVVTDWVTIRP
jgi:hypothetical protein